MKKRGLLLCLLVTGWNILELVTVRVWVLLIHNVPVHISLQRVLLIRNLKLRNRSLDNTANTERSAIEQVEHLQVGNARSCKRAAEVIVLLEGVDLLLLRRNTSKDRNLNQQPGLTIGVSPHLDCRCLLTSVLIGKCTDTELGLLLLREEDDLLFCERSTETLVDTNSADVGCLSESLSVDSTTERLRSEWDRWSSHVVHPISKDSN